MKIQISNCKNIDSAEIDIIEDKLNIKYAMNGTGKSTIAKSVQHFVSGAADAAELTPFKHRDKPAGTDNAPAMTGQEKVTSVALFNEEYMNQFIFRPDELLNNSFEVFVRTPDYEERMGQIDTLIEEINVSFKSSEDIGRVVTDFGVFIDSFGKSKSGYSAAGALAKGIGGGNKIEHIPDGLDVYAEYLRSDKRLPWLSWQIRGTEYLDLSSSCPFCTSDIEATRPTIEKVKTEFDAKSIEHLNAILLSVGNLEKYFSNDTRVKVADLCKRPSALKKEEIAYLVELKEQVQLLREKLLDLREVSYFSLKDSEKVLDRLSALRIDLTFISHLRSEETEAIVDKINKVLDVVVTKAGQLQGEVNKQKQAIERTVAEFSGEINDFLANAGYKYSVLFESVSDQYRLRMRHADYDKSLSKGDQFLSFGERNAFALVLFMYESISKNVDLIILDDPISSFDRNKKFALIDMLFMRERSLKNRTVLMLTHDFEPIVDMMYSLNRRFGGRVVASFISECDGVLTEREIAKQDIKSFTDICNENIEQHSEQIVKLIHLRRLYEIVSNKGLPYQLISSLFHKRRFPSQFVEGELIDLTADEIADATKDIQVRVAGFDYELLLDQVCDVTQLKHLYAAAASNYEKLQLFRIATGEATGDSVLRKYINETFHIENDYLMQLNPCIFQTTPNFIVRKCDKEMELLT
jgi:energy-coupling factor transporter ATP-binding protein EcfA2